MSQRFQLPDRYRVTGHVASGGMAAVYAAHDEILGRDVAVKVLAEHLNEDKSAKLRFQREARAAAGLSSHPHVVTIYDVGEHDGRSFIVMELLSGGSLAGVLRSERRVDRKTAVRWLRDAASALDAAHAAGIVHRDVKPANLLLDDRGGLAIADFGIARVAESDQVTMTGQVLGTASYLSPEQALGEPASDASDRYALAVVAFELLTGRRPFEGEHFAAQARAHIEDVPPRASAVNPELPPAVDAVLQRGMAKDPGDRWPSAPAFVDALEAALTAPDPATTRKMAVQAPTRQAPARPRSAPPAPPPPAPARSTGGSGGGNRWVPIAAVVLALAVAGVAFAAFSGGDGGDGDSDRTARTEERAERTPTPTPTATAEEKETPEPTPTPTATEEPEPEPTPEESDEAEGGGGGGGDPAALNNQGYARYQQGDYAGAVPILQQAVDACGDSGELDPCGYALFNLGSALHRAGRSEEAVPYLERRLANFGYKKGEVRKELEAARAASGG